MATCGECGYYQAGSPDHGHCRRYPPTTVSAAGHVAWPVVAASDWCGEFTAAAKRQPDAEAV
jgi:hypothetical protein